MPTVPAGGRGPGADGGRDGEVLPQPGGEAGGQAGGGERRGERRGLLAPGGKMASSSGGPAPGASANDSLVVDFGAGLPPPGQSLEQADRDGMTLLHHACEQGHADGDGVAWHEMSSNCVHAFCQNVHPQALR